MTADIIPPAFVLIRPQMGENIGAAARAMWNFGLDRMRLVAPRDGWPNPSAIAMASGAGRLLDAAQAFDGVGAAIADCTHVYATTARPRELTKPVMTPEAAMRDAARRAAVGERVAVMFGPERAGMENADVALASTIVSVPVNPEFPSLNLAQCVLLMGYEWRRATTETAPVRLEGQRTELADRVEIERLGDHYEQRLEEAGFFYPDHKAEGMRLNLRNLWARQALTRAEVQMLHGIMRQMVRWKERG
ncbi:RNA methyltransferase [Roseisalinus antarcticus]|uniref:tRNA (Cytidine/uridine-2'-O-)-methyltransferase TrmJ n=1 Tax=Roseisalinus antarcticus TaxID=254357 RepID=A0A1Y5RCQ5_9RHOB|nr:RNA methyltransferase [Roseisalinus antarcticus]SLN14266.1 tRNA (cytidine/uridine-2'-O-)-methyltransferase TrmJ [Roseisalinus antarcticus]